MPEGDSVRLLATRLDRWSRGQVVVRSDLRVPRLATRDLAGRTVLEHATHCKHLLTRFSGDVTLHSHLLMDGEWSVTRPGRQLPRRLLPEVRVVLEQARLAGLGNLWVNELAFLLGRSPWTPVGDVDVDRLVELAATALRHSVTVAGAYQVTTGTARRGESHWVAGRQRRPCLRCGATVRMIEEVPGDPSRRRTWWCPHCQPGPEAPT